MGQFGELKRLMSAELVSAFARVSGDDNPVHLDAEFAAKTRFGRPIAHGMLYSSLFSVMFGASFDGAIYLSQTLEFKRPVFVDDEVMAKMTVVSVEEGTPDHYKVTCDTVILNEAGKPCTTGVASVLLPDPERD